MAAIYPVASTRVSEQLLQARLQSQFNLDRVDLLRLQDQLSTGFRLSAPSDDAPAAARAVTLQRILEQKQQVITNVSATSSYVAATDNALARVSELLTSIRATALSAADTTNSDSQRRVIAQEVNRAIEQLVNVGNQQFRGRYLFAGSRSTQVPFEFRGSNIVYQGNEVDLNSLVDANSLLDSNVTGNEVFGAISPAVRGAADLNPILTLDTKLSALRNGLGVDKGSLLISDGASTKTVNIASAETIGDVVRLIESNPPDGRRLTVRVTNNALAIDIDDAGGGNLTIREVAGGTTASQLGVFNSHGVGVQQLLGDDLAPRLQPTTRLTDILGTRASVVLPSTGANDDIFIEAAENGESLNGVAVQVVSTGGIVGDGAVVTFDEANRVLQINVNSGVTTAATIVNAINTLGEFTARLDNILGADDAGLGPIQVGVSEVFAGGSGIVFDKQSGVQIVNGGQTHTITFETAETVEDLLNLLNGSTASVSARIAADGRGIEVRSRLSGADFKIGENGGNTATELGIRTLNRNTQLSDLNFGRGVDLTGGNDSLAAEPNFVGSGGPHVDFTIQRDGSPDLDIDIRSAKTIGDVIDLINNDPNNGGAAPITARLAEFGNGIQITDENNSGPQSLTVVRRDSFAAWDLGLMERGEESASAGASSTLQGADVNPTETKGVFNSLLRLSDAIENFDVTEIGRAIAMLDDDFERLTFSRADLGARTRSLEVLAQRVQDEDVQLRSALSNEIDADLVKVISDLSARQASIEATLRLVGQTLQLTVLNFI